MADLSQKEADNLIAISKIRTDNKNWYYPSMGGSIRIPIISLDRREDFSLTIWKSKAVLEKNTDHLMCRKTIILLRVDFAIPASYQLSLHRNPDGQEINGSHLHIYREGYDDKWAIPIPNEKFPFPNLNDDLATLLNFMNYCNIVDRPLIQRGLFV